MELKQLIFLGMTVSFIPVAAWFGIRYRWAERMLVAGALFSTCYLIDINFVSMEWYRGDTKGFEFGVTDWMIISLSIVMACAPRWKNKRPEPLPPNATLMLAYFFLAVLSIFVAYVPTYAGFGVFKILRAMAVYWVAYNYLRSEEDLRFYMDLAREEGVLLDPVYTGKAFHGLVTDLRDGFYQDVDDIIFVHTGGVFGLFAHEPQLMSAASGTG